MTDNIKILKFNSNEEVRNTALEIAEKYFMNADKEENFGDSVLVQLFVIGIMGRLSESEQKQFILDVVNSAMGFTDLMVEVENFMKPKH